MIEIAGQIRWEIICDSDESFQALADRCLGSVFLGIDSFYKHSCSVWEMDSGGQSDGVFNNGGGEVHDWNVRGAGNRRKRVFLEARDCVAGIYSSFLVFF
jgi:hypothetical protein